MIQMYDFCDVPHAPIGTTSPAPYNLYTIINGSQRKGGDNSTPLYPHAELLLQAEADRK